MFSRVVTAARGLLVRPESASLSEEGQGSADRILEDGQETKIKDTMVTATRRSTFPKPETESAASTPRTGSPAVNGKRKSMSSTPDVPETHTTKRRKTPAVSVNDSPEAPRESFKGRRFQTMEAVEIISGKGSAPSPRSGSPSQPVGSIQNGASGNTANPGPTHVRFGSEDPVPNMEENEADVTVQNGQDEVEPEQEESDDDDAPEAVSNVAQLEQLKGVERQRDQARQRHEQVKKEKRREHEKRLKSQAASKTRHMSPPALPVSQLQKPKHDELLSESSATLQGSDVKTTGPSAIQSLPTLLPDEILNAEPSARPPTPPREQAKSTAKAASNKLRFLDTVQKRPKDVMVGGTAVRVLDEMTHYNSRTGSNQSLAPKSSKASKNVRESWITGKRNKDISSGVRRTAGGTSGFVRK